ncbi:hypothetical protein, partial [Streptococcus pseudopneumoniae]|uniref:hypothetical protein n=1 Tax=Streptococcus pseudopneumoniae TaxID=257758 RepID=UPI0018B021E7
VRTYVDRDGVEQDNYIKRITASDDSKQRFTFHSPDTSFFQPALPSTLQIETIEYGQSSGKLEQVKKHSGYKIFTDGLY